jgi:hypothetical protein
MIILNGFATVAAPGPVASAWVNKVGVSEDGANILTSTIAGYANSHAGTVGSISSAGGYAEQTQGTTDKTRAFGIDISNNPTGLNSMDYALQIGTQVGASAALGAWENNTDRGAIGNYATNDILRFHVSADGLVEIFQNAAYLYNFLTKAINFPLYGNVAIAELSGTSRPITLGPVQLGSPPSNAVTWRNKTGCLVGVSNVLGAITTGSGATSNESLTSGAGGRFELTCKFVQNNRVFAAGLTTLTSVTDIAQLNFSWYLTHGTDLYIWELGINRGLFTKALNDVLDVRVSPSGVVTYYKNNVLIYTSTVTATFPLYAGAAFVQAGARAEQVRLY